MKNILILITPLLLVILCVVIVYYGQSTQAEQPERTEVAKTPNQTKPNIQGYQDARWGMDLTQVKSAYNTELEKCREAGIFEKVFYELWEVPKYNGIMGVKYKDYYVPKESFQDFRKSNKSNSDRCSFYKGRFCCYYFRIIAENYDAFRGEMISKYGSPSVKRSDLIISGLYDCLTYMWDVGETNVFLIRYEARDKALVRKTLMAINPAAALDASMIEVKVFYFSKDIFEEVKNMVSNKKDAEKEKQQQGEKAQKEQMKEELNKIH